MTLAMILNQTPLDAIGQRDDIDGMTSGVMRHCSCFTSVDRRLEALTIGRRRDFFLQVVMAKYRPVPSLQLDMEQEAPFYWDVIAMTRGLLEDDAVMSPGLRTVPGPYDSSYQATIDYWFARGAY